MKKIEDYNFPKDLKNMTYEQLELLAVQIREFLIEKVSQTGGHLASNLGVVELSIALHRIFNTPEDKIIWDVGHQSYVHKILTGRADRFDSLRKFDGLSGFPKSNESEYDAYDTGHSSTSLSAAFGMAVARDLKKEKNEVVAIIGDGSFTGGMAYEAINNIGASKTKLIIIFNDNGMSISENVGSLSHKLDDLRTSKFYLGAKRFAKEKFKDSINKNLESIRDDIKYTMMPEAGILAESLGLTYFGPVDGHNIKAVCDTIEKAKQLDEPVFIHILTKKGKGYKNAEKNPTKFHGIGPFDPETGDLRKKPVDLTYSQVFGKKILEMAKNDQRIVCITAAMTDGTGLTEFAEQMPERLFDVGIAEEHAVTFAAGLAKAGIRPVVAIYSSFLQRAYDQLIIDCAMQNLPIVFAIDRAGIVGDDGETHNGIFDLSYLSTVPNLTVFTPTTSDELEFALEKSIELNSPVAIRYPRGTVCRSKDTVEPPEADTLILGVGKMYSYTAVDLAEKLPNSRAIPVNQIKPIVIPDLTGINHIVTIEDNIITGGYGQQLSYLLKDKDIDIISFAWPDDFIRQGTFDEIAHKYGLDADSILEKIKLKRIK